MFTRGKEPKKKQFRFLPYANRDSEGNIVLARSFEFSAVAEIALRLIFERMNPHEDNLSFVATCFDVAEEVFRVAMERGDLTIYPNPGSIPVNGNDVFLHGDEDEQSSNL